MSLTEQDSVLIAYILDAIEKIDSLAKAPDFKERFLTDWVTHDAVIRRLQTLAESSQRLSDAYKETQPEIPWKKISGFRNILVHQYLGDIDPEILWHVVSFELPLLKESLTTDNPH